MALRKAKVLFRSGAHLRVVSREFPEPFRKFAKQNRVRMRRSDQLPKNLNGIFLVVAATSDQSFNRAVSKKCEQNGILVNVVDDPKHSSFIVPSVLRRGPLQIAISTGGASPLLAKTLRKKLAAQFGAGYSELVKRLARDRKSAKRKIRLGSERRNYFQKLVGTQLKILERKNGKTLRK